MKNELKKFIGGGEGFRIYTAEDNNRFLLIIDESTTVDLLSEEDAEGLQSEKVLEFSTEKERKEYLNRIPTGK